MFDQVVKSQINNALHDISNSASGLHVDYMTDIINSYCPTKCRPQFLKIYIHLLIKMFQDYFKLSQDKKTVGLQYDKEIDMVNTINNYIADYSDMYNDFIDTFISDEYNIYEQWLLYLLFQYIQGHLDIDNNLYPEEEPELFAFYPIYKEYYQNSYNYFHKLLPTVELSFLFNTVVNTEITLVNKNGFNYDNRSTNSRSYILTDINNITIKKQLDSECPTQFTLSLTNPTIFDIMFSFLKLKSGKFDRCYEMYSHCINLTKELILDFDHGS